MYLQQLLAVLRACMINMEPEVFIAMSTRLCSELIESSPYPDIPFL